VTSAVIPKLLVHVNDCGHRYLRRGSMRFGSKLSLRMFRFASARLDSLFCRQASSNVHDTIWREFSPGTLAFTFGSPPGPKLLGSRRLQRTAAFY